MISELYSPNIARLLLASTYDFSIIDCEHGPFDYSMIAAMTAAARVVNFPLIIRIPKVDRENVLKYLDMGAAGLLAPMISTPEQVNDLVRMARYSPMGVRGISTRRAHNGYLASDFSVYMSEANKHVTLIAQIETRQAIENIDEIARIAGIDGLVVGPNDLSSDLGIYGDYENEKLLNSIRMVSEAANNHGLFSGIITSDMKLIDYCRKLGMDFICWNSEIGILISSGKTIKDKLK
jgi:2-dehydro-3-deoxyglucarate aldolase/4-hydroxy-2-oxoheptanedioate aldolase